MASESTSERESGTRAIGFGVLPCPKCGEAGAVISVDLDGLGVFRCRECEDEFERADVEWMIARWSRVLAWLDAAPGRADG